MHDFIHELVHEFLHFDAKIVRTLKLLLFHPGRLTREYVAGKRAAHVGPIRLFLVSSMIFFGFLALVPVQADVIDSGSRDEAAAELAAAKGALREHSTKLEDFAEKGAQKAIHDPEHFISYFRKAVGKSVFLLVPIFAFLTWRVYRRQEEFFVAHLYFALHLHATGFLILGADLALGLAGPILSRISLVLLPAFLVYFFLAIRGTFGASWAKALIGGSAVLAAYLFVNAAVLAVLALGTLAFM